jgi:catechol 2,3-dioxygenase-like lactoylglutathione lyase family enzyme
VAGSAIGGVHALIYAHDAEAARAFFRDVLELPHVVAHDTWLIFALPPAELGIHPTQTGGRAAGAHELYFMCHDIAATVEALKARDVAFTSDVEERDFGLLTSFEIPGAGQAWLYEPKHPSPLDAFP